MKRSIFLFLIFSFPLFSTELPPLWIKLLHYEKKLFGGLESQANSASFFLAKDGKTNPQSEWQENLKAFKNPFLGNKDDHPACRFPARFHLIKKTYPRDKDIKKVHCPSLEKFKKQMKADQLALVFSSYYLNNPASTFGHTFLRFINKNNRAKSELLDFATNYGANVDTDNPFIYAFKGLAGGFNGEFSVMPFFYKVREYNDYESRDLWSYTLNLSQDQINFLLLHLWELKQTYFTYYYATKNCSYQILALLDAVNPQWKLTGKIPPLVLPIDTLYEINKIPNLVGDIQFRPSKRRVLLERMKKKEAKSDLQKKANSLDLEIDYFDFIHSKELIKEDKEILKEKHQLLLARAKIDFPSEKLVIKTPKNEAPHLGHPSKRATLAAGFEKERRGYQQLEFRYALHDRHDPRPGQPQMVNLEIFDLKVRHYSHVSMRHKFVLERFDLLDVESLVPYNSLISPINWKFSLGAKTLHDKECRLCLTPASFFGAGYSFGNSDLYAKIFLNSEFNIQPRIGKKGYLFDMGPEVELFYRPNSRFNFSYSLQYFHRLFSNLENFWFHTFNIRHHLAKNYSLGIQSEVRKKVYLLQTQLYFYF